MFRLLAVALLLAAPSIADASSFTAKINRILIYEAGDLVYVYPVGGVVNPPACHGSNGNYTSFKMSRPRAREYLSMLMAAHLAKKSVGFFTADDCVDQANSATLRYFIVNSD
jgi:hypothetical protein